ncbi:MAG: c-type cytochrome [Bdellovibrionales bacterium]|nr:c-type cytochrome [Bdellovibrionales bacterium]
MSQDNSNEPLLNHEYDGIRELDYPLPAWWLATFFATIIFAFIYYIHYEVSKAGPSSQQELEMNLAEVQALQQKAQDAAPKVSEDTLKGLMADNGALEAGKAEFLAKCAACHGQMGEGLIGPNLTDNAWKNTDGTLVGIHNIIVQGVTDKGMPAWKGLIDEALIQKVAVYIGSLKGSTPPNGKPAEGQVYE